MLRTPICALCLTSMLVLSACAARSNAASSPGDETPSDPQASLASVPGFTVGPTGIIADVTSEACEAAPGTVTASGTAANSGKFARDLVVVVTWVVPGGSADASVAVAREIAELDDVDPAESRDWSVSGEVPPGVAAACVVTAYAGQLGQVPPA